MLQSIEFGEDSAEAEEQEQLSLAQETSDDDGRLSPIPEGTEPSTDSVYHIDQLLLQEDPELRQALYEAEIASELTNPVSLISKPSYIPEISNFDYDDAAAHVASQYQCEGNPVSNYHVVSANLRAGLPWDHNLEYKEAFSEIYFEGDTWKLLSDVPRPPREGEVCVLRIYHAEGVKRAVIVKDDDILTKEEEKLHAKELEAAQLKELETWAKFKCFSRKQRRNARNVIDCRWVNKWKWEIEAQSVEDASKSKAVSRRVIRARLTVRGFKDLEKHLIDRYAGTAQRYSQRALVSEAVVQGWDVATTDISKAFLQGVTYEELARITGEPQREVNFYLPHASVHLLNKVPGFESFDPVSEVLHCDKPGTGSVDAPRCFSMKLQLVTSDKCGMISCTIDPEMCVLHKKQADGSSKCVAILTKHVDDLKVAGVKEVVEWILKEIQDVFGNLKIIWNEFTNCGICHIQDKITKEITLDQLEYAAKLRVITHAQMRTDPSTAACCTELHKLYMSLLGAVAYLYLTRTDVLVFISACQKVAHCPQIIHVKRLNFIVRWIQRNPKKLHYRKLGPKTHLRVISDASFKKEDDKGHSLRGALYFRGQGDQLSDFSGDSPGHLIEFMTKTIRHVCRSTFAAELHACCDSVDLGILIALMLHEINTGPVSKSDARILRDRGGYSIPLSIQVDAMSVFAAITATFVKAPAEKSLLSHVQYMREILDSKVLAAILWVDTRDMYSDGMTKGSVERELIQIAMSGKQTFRHSETTKIWSAKMFKAPEVPSKLVDMEIDVTSLGGYAVVYYTLSYRNLDF